MEKHLAVVEVEVELAGEGLTALGIAKDVRDLLKSGKSLSMRSKPAAPQRKPLGGHHAQRCATSPAAGLCGALAVSKACGAFVASCAG